MQTLEPARAPTQKPASAPAQDPASAPKRGPAPTPAPGPQSQLAEEHPRGTLLLSLTYVVLLGLLWGFMYLRMVKGG